MSALPTSWVAGTINIGSNPSPYKYKNHNYTQCGGSSNELMCGNNYYVNSPLISNQNQYGVNDKQTSKETCLGIGGCPVNGCGLDYSVCPNIGGIQSQVQWSSTGNGTNGKNLQGTKSTVACLYPLATFNDLQAVLDYKNEFGENDAYNQQILPQFCSTQTTIGCPLNPGTGLPMQACSQFVSKQTNNPCGDWLRNTAATDKINGTVNADNAIINYCKYYNSPDCLCINRFYSPIYQVMSYGQTGTTDSCWWLPCEDTPDNPTTYLVPSTLPPCVAGNVQICNNVNIAVGGSSTGLTFNPNLYTNCTLTPTNNTNGGTTNNTTNTFSGVSLWVIIVAVIAIIIIIVLMVLIK
jgi:hypothetical protein